MLSYLFQIEKKAFLSFWIFLIEQILDYLPFQHFENTLFVIPDLVPEKTVFDLELQFVLENVSARYLGPFPDGFQCCVRIVEGLDMTKNVRFKQNSWIIIMAVQCPASVKSKSYLNQSEFWKLDFVDDIGLKIFHAVSGWGTVQKNIEGHRSPLFL